MKKQHKRITIWILVVSVVFIVIGIYYSGTETPISDDLLGVWTTSAPRYADRSFEITKDLIIFGSGSIYIDSGSISKIEKEDQGSKRLYVIYYDTTEGGEQQFSFYYEPIGGGAIRLKNQEKIVWNKIEGGEDPPKVSDQ